MISCTRNNNHHQEGVRFESKGTYSPFDASVQEDINSESKQEMMMACTRNNEHYQKGVRFESKGT